MRRALLVAALLAGCHSVGSFTTAGPHRYAETRMKDVDVLDVAPEGAELIGVVEGYKGFESAVTDARRLAAEIGADAIVVTGEGLAPYPGAFGQRAETVRANAYRLRE